MYVSAKACISLYANGAYFEFKKFFPHVSSNFKQISPKIFGPHCVSLIPDKERKLWKLLFRPRSLLNLLLKLFSCIKSYFLRRHDMQVAIS
jgi:hypothetical protein